MANTRIKIFGTYREENLDSEFEVDINYWLKTRKDNFVVNDIKFVPIEFNRVKVIVIYEL